MPLEFEYRPGEPNWIACPQCVALVPLPTEHPWLLVDGQAIEPELESVECPTCGTVIPVKPPC